MADDKETTQFCIDFGGIRLELSGERSFVEEMYRQVMADVDAARAAVAEEDRTAKKRTDSGSLVPVEKPASIWVHRASDLMRKIYMVSVPEVEETILSQVIVASKVRSIYIEKNVFDEFFPGLDGSHTLWAEFTAAGREKIAEVTEPMRKALRHPGASRDQKSQP